MRDRSRWVCATVRRLALLGCVVLLALLCAAPPAAARISAGQTGFRVLDYDARLDLRRPGTLHGRVTVTLVVTGRLPPVLIFDAAGLRIERVSSHSGAPLPFRTDGAHLRLPSSRLRPVAKRLRLDFRYSATAGRGLRWRGEQISAMFHTRRWLVCVDQPAARATLTLRLLVPRALTAIAVGEPRGRSDARPNGSLYTFRLSTPHSPYLYGFAVGRFRRVVLRRGGRRYLVASVRHREVELRRVAKRLPEMTAFFEAKAGVALPGKRFSLVVLEGAAAQELAQMAFVGARYVDLLLRDPHEDWLLAHELAHQWWGNRVTNRTWSHFWLHEGLVTFMVAAYKEQRWGRAAYEREIQLFRRRYRTIVSLGKDRPLVHDRWRLSSEMGGPLPYSKGALILHLLREKLGTPRFWRALRRFTRRFQGKLVVTADFRRALERELGAPLAAFFRRHVFGTGLAGEERK
ncbi:MAG: hypothetical protein KC609_15685 [Myxococcales bacterium]|nr:hypothetical protein [Myxococcales bacterium]